MTDDTPSAAREIVVSVTGRETTVTPLPGWTVGAITTRARWQLGCGSGAFDNWEIRSADGTLLDPHAMPGALDRLVVNRLAGIGA